jgi:glycosyltransferase involved in cell wall biosynthesis
LRIAVYENLPPGGALRASYEIGRHLLRRGHEIDLYRLSTYTNKGSFDLGPLANQVRTLPFEPLFGSLDGRLREGHLAPRSYTLFGPLQRLHRKLAEQIRTGGYDVVLVHPDAMTHSPYLLRWLGGVPSVYYCQEPPRHASEIAVREAHKRKLGEVPGPVAAIRLLEDRVILDRLVREDMKNVRQAAIIAVNSVYSRERAWAAYARNAMVCYLGIDPELFTPERAKQSRRAHEVLSVGSPVLAKNHDLVVRALATLPRESRPALRVVLPRPGGTESLERLARELDVELTIETGIDEAAMVERYRQALATVCAARLEPFGLTAVESMACGTPVVAIREGGFRESVADGRTGFLVDPDAGHIADAIGSLVADPRLVRRMSVAAREAAVNDWSWDQSAARMEAILRLAMAR